MVRSFLPSWRARSAVDGDIAQSCRSFVWLGLLLLLILASGLGWSYYRSQMEQVTTQAHRVARALSLTLSSWPVDVSFPMSVQTLPSLLSSTSQIRDDTLRHLDARLRRDAEVAPVLQLNLYNVHGDLIYTSDRTLPRAEGVEVRSGRAMVAESPLDLSVEGFVPRKTFVLVGRTLSSSAAYRVFHPLRSLENGAMVGVIEVFVDLQPAMEILQRNLWQMGLYGSLGLLLFYSGFVILARRLQRHVSSAETRQTMAQTALIESETHLGRVQDAMENTIAERTLRLKQSEARFREFAESASDWLWECDPSARVTYVSEGFTRIMGADRSQIVGHLLWEVSDLPEDDEKWESFRALISTMKPFRDFSYRFRTASNSRRVISLNGTPIFDERAVFHGFRGTGSDITVQYEAEQTILHLGRILEQSANEVLVFEDGALRILQANRGARQNLGYGMDELAAMTMLEILPTESRVSLESRLGRLRLYPGEISVFESVFERSNHTRYPVEARIQYMAEEKPPVFVAVLQNITARKQAEQALAESEERYRSVAEMSLDAILVHVDGIIVFANQQATVIAHAGQPTALVGHPISAFIAADQDRPQDLATVFSPLAHPTSDAVGTDEPQTYKRLEVRLRRLDGSSFDAELSSSPITFGGRPAVQTILRDITQHKIVQGQLIQTAKLATLGEMAAGMAHELSQPMNVIRMAAEGALLERCDGTVMDPASQAAFEVISSQASRMGEIIDHMRIFSRKQADDVGVFDPLRSIELSVAMLETQLRAEDIQIVIADQTPEDDVLLVRGRPVHLEQVILNLLTNARHALRSRLQEETIEQRYAVKPAGEPIWSAQITVTLSRNDEARDDESTAPPMLKITVQDTGGGIPAEHIERIFEPFYTTKEVGSGTGLGLSVSFSLISAMGGTISVANIGEGACFTICLPLSDAEEPTEHSVSAAAEDEQRGVALSGPRGAFAPAAFPDEELDDDEPSALIPHILVVDDETPAALLIGAHMQRLGYRVSTAEDGEQGFGIFLDDPPDLIITDLRMPRCGGEELIARVHEHIPDLPVIVVTGHLGHLEASASELKKVTAAILKKPVSLAELGSLVQRALLPL